MHDLRISTPARVLSFGAFNALNVWLVPHLINLGASILTGWSDDGTTYSFALSRTWAVVLYSAVGLMTLWNLVSAVSGQPSYTEWHAAEPAAWVPRRTEPADVEPSSPEPAWDVTFAAQQAAARAKLAAKRKVVGADTPPGGASPSEQRIAAYRKVADAKRRIGRAQAMVDGMEDGPRKTHLRKTFDTIERDVIPGLERANEERLDGRVRHICAGVGDAAGLASAISVEEAVRDLSAGEGAEEAITEAVNGLKAWEMATEDLRNIERSVGLLTRT